MQNSEPLTATARTILSGHRGPPSMTPPLSFLVRSFEVSKQPAERTTPTSGQMKRGANREIMHHAWADATLETRSQSESVPGCRGVQRTGRAARDPSEPDARSAFA